MSKLLPLGPSVLGVSQNVFHLDRPPLETGPAARGAAVESDRMFANVTEHLLRIRALRESRHWLEDPSLAWERHLPGQESVPDPSDTLVAAWLRRAASSKAAAAVLTGLMRPTSYIAATASAAIGARMASKRQGNCSSKA